MNNWSEIIKQISVKQRLFALFILVLFPVISFLGGKHLDNNDCRIFIEENKLLHGDLMEISSLIRKQKIQEALANVSSEDDYATTPMETLQSVGSDKSVEISMDSMIVSSGEMITLPSVDAMSSIREVKAPLAKVPTIKADNSYLDDILKITDKH